MHYFIDQMAEQDWRPFEQERKERFWFDFFLWLRRPSKLRLIGLLLVTISLWGLVAIYGPVVRAETYYRVQGLVKFSKELSSSTSSELITEEVRSYGIVIPSLYLSEPVVENVNPTDKGEYRRALETGVAHAAGTGLPGDGTLGYYFAHSSGVWPLREERDAVFYLIGKLEEHDKIIFYREGERYEYSVVEKRVTEKNDVSFLSEKPDAERIVLQTCWPIGTNNKRLLVFAELVE